LHSISSRALESAASCLSYGLADPRALRSFPTRRSSDLFLAGGLFLLGRRVIGWHAPVGMLAALLVMSLLFWNGSGSDSHGSPLLDRKSTRLNSSHVKISYAVFCLKKKKK